MKVDNMNCLKIVPFLWNVNVQYFDLKDFYVELLGDQKHQQMAVYEEH